MRINLLNHLVHTCYANEVGEAFRALVPVSVVRASYLVASGYVVADAAHKGNQAKEMQWKTESVRTKKILHAIGDTIIWQGLASVAIPGFTINRICAISQLLLRKTTTLPAPIRKWTTTAVGLGMIPIIITPIDRSVDYFMNNSIRKWYHIEEEEEKIVHHTR
ncbi:mitochondrial fission process protein 1-like isoform X4 [Anneissia japonica]|uniref:mitochondrial fission process protein 1-like isoform X4 n=1 Tax=Anneissia japonica TaxID=1529436 RepID=UPI0014258AB8|nr:mitochondrial fission process protein 1-like isoform X4 [Anneissia japonica]